MWNWWLLFYLVVILFQKKISTSYAYRSRFSFGSKFSCAFFLCHRSWVLSVVLRIFLTFLHRLGSLKTLLITCFEFHIFLSIYFEKRMFSGARFFRKKYFKITTLALCSTKTYGGTCGNAILSQRKKIIKITHNNFHFEQKVQCVWTFFFCIYMACIIPTYSKRDPFVKTIIILQRGVKNIKFQKIISRDWYFVW